MTNDAVTRPAVSAWTPDATTWPSQRMVTLFALDRKLAPITAIPVWPRLPMFGVISTEESGFSNTA